MKYLFDLSIIVLSLPFLLPLMILIIILVKYNLGSPVFFLQQRPGLNDRPFQLVKFRTMCNVVGADGLPLSYAACLHRFGRFLRSTSLDEIPELWNVMKGHMSLVGPRPLLMEYLPFYSHVQNRRHEVKPGITGWAQINGRNALSWEEKFKLDVWYVDNCSFWLDIKIIFLTIKKVLIMDGIAVDGEATVVNFKGNNRDD